MICDSFTSPYGDFIIEEQKGKIVRIYPGSLEKHETSTVSTLCKNQLTEYFEGKRKQFDVPVFLTGSTF